MIIFPGERDRLQEQANQYAIDHDDLADGPPEAPWCCVSEEQCIESLVAFHGERARKILERGRRQ